MEGILDFLENNYIWFLVAAVILLFALVGFIVDSKRKQKKMEGNFEGTGNTAPLANEVPVSPVENVNTPVEETTEAPVFENNTEVQTPVESAPEVIAFNEAPVENTNSNDMTFNDIPTPQVNETPVVEAPVQEEIIEPFNIGTPVEAPAVSPVVEEPVVTPSEPVIEPVNQNPAPTEASQVVENQEPVVNIQE